MPLPPITVPPTPSPARVKAIADMMYELGMYTQSREVLLLGEERDMLRQLIGRR